jgi:histidinol phosphatase-like PHP family hydrolase
MSDITQILKKYKDMDITDIVSHPDISRDITIIQKSNAPIDDQTSKFLRDLGQAIEIKTSLIENEMSDLKNEIDAIQTRTEANLAYRKQKG